MTDGERLVWASSYALAHARLGDAVAAVHAATLAIMELREASLRRTTSGVHVISQMDERDFIDEIVSAP